MNIFTEEEILRIKSTFAAKYPPIENYLPLKDFEVKDDDVFLIGFPKSGTTWAQELVWLVANDLNYEGAKVFIDERFPNLEIGIHVLMQPHVNNVPECHLNSVEFVKNMKSPRFIKSHLGPMMLPIQLLNGEKKPKIIYVARNPKDVCVSAYYFIKYILKITTASLDDYCKIFLSDLSPLGSYWETLLYFWNRRHEDNILFIKYEEMKDNLLDVIRRIASFFDKSLTTKQEKELLNWLDFESIKNNPAVNHESLYNQSGFIRKGKVGDHKSELSQEILAYFDIWINESTKNTDYKV